LTYSDRIQHSNTWGRDVFLGVSHAPITEGATFHKSFEPLT